MRIDLRSVSPVGKRNQLSRACECEPLEQRVVLSVSALAVAPLAELPIMTAAAVQPTVTPAASVVYPGGITVTDTFIRTSEGDIPRFAANPTNTTLRSGLWSDATIWSAGHVPSDHDRVSIPANMTITYTAASNARLDAVEISGSLVFGTGVNTRLIASNVTVMPTGKLQIGSVAAPISKTVKAELIIADQPLNLAKDPSQYGNSLIGLGTVSIVGSTLDQTWLRLSAEPLAGATSLTISPVPTTWKTGDTLVLPDTRQVPTTETRRFDAGDFALQTEEVTIDRIVGNKVFLTKPLLYNHKGAYNSSGGLELLPHVANLTRNVVVRSENPDGNRGHTLFTARANVDIEYARFQDLGRTSAFSALDNTTYNSSGQVTHVGTNQTGRYAVYFERLWGPVNSQNKGFQYRFIGNTVDGSLRWGVALEDTSYGLISKNVVYDAQGAGFVTGEGTEIGNSFTSNITIQIKGTYEETKEALQNDDYATGGSGFWFRRGGNPLLNNVAADSSYAGFVYNGYYVDAIVDLPAFRGADLDEPGQSIPSRLSPAQSAVNNEAYGLTSYGLWAAFIAGDNLLENEPPTVFSNLRLWNVLRSGVTAYHTANVTFDKMLLLANVAAQDRNDEGTMGMDLANYENRDLVVQNSRIEGFRTGFISPKSDSSQVGADRPTVIKNSVLKNYVNIVVTPPADDRGSNGNALEIRNVKFLMNKTLPPNGPADYSKVQKPFNIQMDLYGTTLALTQPSVVKVYDYNQVPGDNFQVFYREQAASYVLPGTNPFFNGSRDEGLIGSPLAGLTNAQNWARFGLSFGGLVAPSNALSRSDVDGLVSPIVAPTTAPRVVLVTPWDGSVINGNDYIRIRSNVSGAVPNGAKVWYSIDGKPAFSKFNDGGVFFVGNGKHTLRAYLGDAKGVQISGSLAAISNFTVNLFASASIVAAPQVVPVVDDADLNAIAAAVASQATSAGTGTSSTTRKNA